MKILRSILVVALLGLPFIATAADTIDINSAGKQKLMQLNGVGEARAEAIIEYREKHGDFESVTELSEVNGIGPATLENNRDMITAGNAD